MSDLNVANNIVAQLGGSRFIALTGAKNFVGGDNYVQFGIPLKTKNQSNKVRITLNANDLYDVEFFYVRGTSLKEKGSFNNVYADNLLDVFESATGVYGRF